ncbi:probable glutamate receptor [Penaeus japonicus]|uniref:probable glutamate receptor n=1 Tax=Penaeus japonicus TaxID=27405 RepID=UPI001C70D29D|nr:probable glutamate receptor [Penaeus japonicus]
MQPRSTCYRVKDGQWGAVVDGHWTGMLREVKDGEADIGVGPLGITLKRTSIVDFLFGIIASEPTDQTPNKPPKPHTKDLTPPKQNPSFRIALRRPSNEDYMWSVYTKQFDVGVWVFVLFVIAGLVLCLYFVSCVFVAAGQVKVIPLSDCALTVIGIFCGQGSTLPSRSSAARTVVITALLLQVVTLSYYTSNMVSALTVGPRLPPYKDLGDIHAQSSITFGIINGSRNTDDFTDSKNPLHQSVWRRMKEDDLAITATQGMERVYEEKYALMLWGIYFQVNYAHDCRVFTLPKGYFPTYTSFAITKGSPLVPVLNKLVLDIISSGFLRKWWQELSNKGNDCNALETVPIELKTVLTPFLLLIFGIFVALVIKMKIQNLSD